MPNLISLTKEGLRVLADVDPDFAAGIHPHGPIRRAGIHHHLLVVDARLYTAKAAQLQGLQLARWSNAGGFLKKQWGLNRYHLEPDGLAALTGNGDVFRLAVEADVGSEALSVIKRKLAIYRQSFNDGVLHELWFIIDYEGIRRVNLAKQIVHSGIDRKIRIMTADAVRTRPITPPSRLVLSKPNHQTQKTPSAKSRNLKSKQEVKSHNIAHDTRGDKPVVARAQRPVARRPEPPVNTLPADTVERTAHITGKPSVADLSEQGIGNPVVVHPTARRAKRTE